MDRNWTGAEKRLDHVQKHRAPRRIRGHLRVGGVELTTEALGWVRCGEAWSEACVHRGRRGLIPISGAEQILSLGPEFQTPLPLRQRSQCWTTVCAERVSPHGPSLHGCPCLYSLHGREWRHPDPGCGRQRRARLCSVCHDAGHFPSSSEPNK